MAYLRPPRRELRRSDWRSSDSLLSEAAMNCLSRSSKLAGSAGAGLPRKPPPSVSYTHLTLPTNREV